MRIECDVDWVDRDETIDEAVRNAVIERLVDKVSNEFYPEIEKQASARLAASINELLAKLTDRFMNKEIIVTDNWGDVQEKHANVNDLLKTKFDAFLTQKVDKNGNSGSCSYGGAKYTRIDFFIDQRIKEHADRITKQIASEMDAKLASKKAEFMAEAGVQIAKKLGLDK